MGEGGRPLVLCYGNRLRRDDGVAWHVAERLGGDRRLDGADLVCSHQLTPELAVEVSRASLVVVVDAVLGGSPGTVERRAVTVERASSATLRWSHGLTPAALAGLSGALYGRVPPMEAVTVAAGSLAAGEGLSTAVERAVAAAADAVAAIVCRGGGRDQRPEGRGRPPLIP
jgi:hydrogenase maturation protease